MPAFLTDLLSPSGFMPHGHCYLWRPEMVWLHVISDAFVAAAYTTIPFTLLYFVRKRRDVPFDWMLLCFGVFIIACGTTHIMEIWTLWEPVYWLSGGVKVVTAIASVSTALLLVRLLPKLLAIPTPAQLQRANDELRQLHDVLESRVEERTRELIAKNAELAREIEGREQSEARRAAVMEASLDAILVVTEEGAILEANPAADRIFGEGMTGSATALADLFATPESFREATREQVGRRFEIVARRKDGTTFPAELALVRIAGREDGSEPLLTATIHDITARKQAAEAEILRREKEAAEEANSELEAFSYSVAHDLRSPLRTLSGFSTMLLEDYSDVLDDTGKTHLSRITANAERMAETIDALLALARLSRTEPARKVVDLRHLAELTIEQLRAGDPGRTVEFVAAGDLEVEGDPHLLRVLLDNLLGNAWKFTRKAPTPRIELGREGGSAGDETVFYVRDNGAGFDMKRAAQLFMPFRRLHTTNDFEGTGVGLATVQRIVRRHGGRVWAQAVERGGATFRFTLSAASS